MQLTVELTDAQMAELGELSAIKRMSREELAAYAVADYLDEVRLPRYKIDPAKLDELVESIHGKRAQDRLALK